MVKIIFLKDNFFPLYFLTALQGMPIYCVCTEYMVREGVTDGDGIISPLI